MNTHRTQLFALAFAAALVGGAAQPVQAAEARPPNVIIILADDMGYGDLSSSRQGTGIQTPAIDRLAAEGARMTSGYAPASTCTPSRYAMLTGEYAWRKEGTGILPGDAALIIAPERTTLAGIFKQAGYATGLVGKWHLGLGDDKHPVDFNGTIKPGPNELGFDYAFHMPATGDRVPTVYMENGRVVNLDAADPIAVDYNKKIGNLPATSSGSIINNIPRIGWMSGGTAALWVDQTKSDIFNAKALDFIRRHRSKPFFLYYAAHEPHVPQAPNQRYAGKGGHDGARGDAIVQLDEQVAAIMKTLKDEGLDVNTLVIFSSDNGRQVPNFDPVHLSADEFRANGIYRGGKYSAFEGGQRMPFLARWPGHIKPGTVSAEPVSLVDMPATAAALTGRKLAPADAPDSFDILPVLTEGAKSPHAVLFYGNETLTGMRAGRWKLITEKQHFWQDKTPEKDQSGPPYLYDLDTDPGELNNVAGKYPELVQRLQAALADAKQAGFTRPGAQKVKQR
jgi:arylsulfatase A-like enzyme